MRHLCAALVLLATGGIVASCASVIDASGYQSAADLMCGCTELKPIRDCVNWVDNRLSSGNDDQVAKWLENYDSLNCGARCENTPRCIDRAPVCLPAAAACTADQQCCGDSTGKAYCYQKKCKTCAPCRVILEEQSNNQVDLCEQAKNKAVAIGVCICNACPVDCGTYCADPNNQKPTQQCLGCFFQSLSTDCAAAVDECKNDQGL